MKRRELAGHSTQLWPKGLPDSLWSPLTVGESFRHLRLGAIERYGAAR